MTATVAEIERVAYLAWPARESVACNGWVLRYGDGFSRRINSVAATRRPTRPMDVQLDDCRLWYEERRLPLLVRITPETVSGLDDTLHRSGFLAEGHTIVMTRSDLPEGAVASGVRIAAAPDEEWIDAELGLAGVDGAQAAAWLSVVRRIPKPAGFATAVVDGEAVAAGIGVVVDEWLGVFEVVVDPELRRRGHGRVLMAALQAWALDHGARRVFLQVVVENRAAISLYEALGYRETYRYWYRRSPT